ncbi:MAG: 2-amino-thiazoline-4-carboxylic acid hydrolase [Rhodospirillaceae bacterium]|nr:2-amino-thiazoline-4-carboxylic acid hydrolase [Rhodospirillaceae bacterium]|tara:strand:+ start:186 stop:665 length:480 start_codon:yes stop_codon:yes gene_type:complete
MHDEIPILQRRKIEARVIKPIYEEMVAELGEEAARSILSRAIKRDAISHGKNCAASQDGANDIAGFVKLFELWTAEDALEVDVLEQTNSRFNFNVTRCRYAEMYRDMGISELGSVLSCGRDGHFCAGFNPRLKLDRSQTIMRGAGCCDFRYSLVEEGNS